MHPAPFFIFAFMSHLIWAEGFITAPFLGPAFPIPRNVSTNGLSIAASKSLSSNILQYLHSGGGGFGNDTTSFSMSIFSVHESSSIFEYHHTAQPSDGATEVVANVTADTIFSIGSISKVLTVYALLQQERKFHFDDPITAYIPELRDAAGPQEQDGPDNVSRVSWDEVTVGSLAGHMAGIGRDCELCLFDRLHCNLQKFTDSLLISKPCRSCKPRLPLDSTRTATTISRGHPSLCWE